MKTPKERYADKLIQAGKRLRQYREAHGITQETVAFVSGLSFTTINNFENGHLNISLASLYAICDGLNIRPSVIIED